MSGVLNLEQLTFSQSLYFERHTLVVMSHVRLSAWTRKGTKAIEKRTLGGFAFRSSSQGPRGLKGTGDFGNDNARHLDRGPGNEIDLQIDVLSLRSCSP